MKTKTSPKAWSYQNDPDTGDRVVVDEDFMVICRRPSEANARLIAAAPDMLAALVELVNSPDAKQNAYWDRARAAIAKAEGKNGGRE